MTGNGHIKMSVFYKELQAMRSEFGQELKEIRKDIGEYHSDMTALNERVNTHRDEIDHQRKRGNTYDVLNSVGIGIMGVIGYIFGQK